MQDTVNMMDDTEYDEEEPSFSDPEDFEDDVEDEGERPQETPRLSRPGANLSANAPLLLNYF